MTRTTLVGIGLFCLGAWYAAASGQDPPAHPVPAVDPAVEKVLDRLEAKGNRVVDLQCSLTLKIEDTRTFEITKKMGRLLFLRGKPNSLFRVDFTRLVEADGTRQNREEWHIFDGRWYIEARAFTKTVIRREIVREGETIDPFKLGSGPFPLPFGQKKAEILKHFRVELVPPKADASDAVIDHLKCIPRAGSPMSRDYRELHFHVDRKLDLPVEIVTHQRKDGKWVSATFRKLKTNTGLDRADLSKKFDKSWTTQVERLPPP